MGPFGLDGLDAVRALEEDAVNKPSGQIVADYGPEEAAMQAYFKEGEARAMALGNRGPIRFGPDGKLDPEILASYNEHGFYVFEGAGNPGRAGRHRGRPV